MKYLITALFIAVFAFSATSARATENCEEALSIEDEWVDRGLPDTSAPVIELFDLPDPYWGPGNLSFNLRVSDESPVCVIIGVPGYFGVLQMTTINAPRPGTLHFSVPGTLAIAEGTERLGVVVLDKAGNVTTVERTLHLINPVQGRLSDKIELIRLDLLGNDVSPEERD